MTQKHHKQIAAFNDPTRHRFLLAGRRGGKTTLIVEDICRSISLCPSNGEIFYIGPTNQQSLELIWEPLQERLYQLRWKFKDRVSKQRFEFSNARKIYIIGGEKIRRIRGHKAFRAYLDELAFFNTPLDQIMKAVRPALSDLKGRMMACTTPNGKGTEAYDFYLNIQGLDSWAYHHWTTAENPFIDPLEIENAKKEMDERSFRQEYLATWESFAGLAYYSFDENLNVRSCSEIDPMVPLAMAWDFNVNPMTLLLIQKDKSGKHYVRKEYSPFGSNTPATVRLFVEDFRAKKDELLIHIHGDASGSARESTTGRSDYQFIEDILTREGFHFEKRIKSKNPPIKDRVAHLNGALKNYYGQSSVVIDPSCKHLIRDLGSQELDGSIPSDKNNLGHKADALGYYINWHHSNSQLRPIEEVQIR